MNAVTNATPLISLALLGHLDLLQGLFSEVIVPSAVYEEVAISGEGRPGAALVASAGWLVVQAPRSRPGIQSLLLGLDSGELEVLLLAQETDPDWVLIDERLARRVARALGLPLKGTLGILLSAAIAGLISKEEALRCLEELPRAGIRIASRWRAWLERELAGL